MRKFLLLIFFMFIATDCFCDNIWFYGPGEATNLEETIGFDRNDQKIITGGATDPSVSPTTGGTGSLYLRTTGDIYIKKDSGLTANWNIIFDDVLAPSSVLNDILVFDGSDWVNQATASLTGIEIIDTATIEKISTNSLKISGSTPITSISTGSSDNDKLPTVGHLMHWLNSIIGTRLMDGGAITISATDGAKFDVSAGYGYIVNNYTDPNDPSGGMVTWSATTMQTITNLATDSITFLVIDSSSNIIQLSALPTPEQIRDYIFIGSIIHTSHVAINGLNNAVAGISFDIGPSLYDLTIALGPRNVGNGNTFVASGANMKIDKTAGYVYQFNSNLKNNKKDPHRVNVSQCTECDFFYTWKDGAGGFNTATASEINADAYDDNSGGALEPGGVVAVQKWSVQRGWITTDQIILHYGQEVYLSQGAAENSINTEDFSKNPALDGALYRVWIIVRGGATSLLADAKFIHTADSTAGGQAAVSLNKWVSVEIDHTTNPNTIAGCNKVFIADASGGAVVATLPDSSTSNNECQTRFYLDDNTNGFTITTVGGTQLIGGETSQVISQEAKGFTVLSLATGPKYIVTQDSRFLAGTTDGAIQRWNNVTKAWEEVSNITATESLLSIDGDADITGTVSISELGVTTAATTARLTVTGTVTLSGLTEVATKSICLSLDDDDNVVVSPVSASGGDSGVVYGGGAGPWLELLALQNSLIKSRIGNPLPNPGTSVQAFDSTSKLLVWPRKIYDASEDGLTMYLDHGLDTELETQNDFETSGDFTAGTNTPTIADNATNYLEGTQSLAMSKTVDGSIDMYDTVVLGLLDRNLRVSFYPDTITNVASAYIQLYTSAGNTVNYDYPVSDMTADAWNNFTVDLNTDPDSSAGTFERATITRIYFGFTTLASQSVSVSWDLSRIISDEPLLVPDYSLELPTQDTTNQEIISIVSMDATDSSKFTISATASYDFPDGLSKANLDDVFMATQTGTVSTDMIQSHDSTHTGQAAKTAYTTETIYLPTTLATATLESSTRFHGEVFEVKAFPTTGTITLDSTASDKSAYFLDDDYIFLFKKLRVGSRIGSMEGSHTSNFMRLQLNANATYASDEISLAHDGSNAHGSDSTGYYVVRVNAKKKYIAGNKTANTATEMTPTEFLIHEDSIPYFDGISAHWKMDEVTGDLKDSYSTHDLSRKGNVYSINGKFEKGQKTAVSTVYARRYSPVFNNAQGVSSKFSVGIWVKFVDTSHDQFLFTNTVSTYGYDVSMLGLSLLNYAPDLLVFGEHSADRTEVAIAPYYDDEWHYVVGVVDSGSTSGNRKWLYIDGVSVGDAENTANQYTDADGYITVGGVENVNSQWEGGFDDVEYYHGYAMSENEIQMRYHNGVGKRFSPYGGYTVKYKETDLTNVDKAVIFGINDRSDTTNDEPKHMEDNTVIYQAE